jgi:hypothetical protein
MTPGLRARGWLRAEVEGALFFPRDTSTDTEEGR